MLQFESEGEKKLMSQLKGHSAEEPSLTGKGEQVLVLSRPLPGWMGPAPTGRVIRFTQSAIQRSITPKHSHRHAHGNV